MNKFRVHLLTPIAAALVLALASGPALADRHERDMRDGRWMAGDFHNHTFLTDGSNVEADVLSHAFEFGLDWMANSEHGGAYNRDPSGQPWSSATELLGNPPKGNMWRWQSLWQYSYPIIAEARGTYPEKRIIQAYEWNAPTHEHISVGIVGAAEDGGRAVARHEYLFDAGDIGATSDSYLGVTGKSTAKTHDKAVAGMKWLEDNYRTSSYALINHPSRQQKYTIADIRDFNNVAPHVAFGFEALPGHQKEASRGGYGSGPFKDAAGNDVTYRARTYGGADYMLAKVGGLWDALLGEGRHFWAFTNSDFHNVDGDFWPGEYSKSFTYVRDSNRDGDISYTELLDGLRSGNSFAAQGGIIDGLKFSAQCHDGKAGMGDTLDAHKGCNLTIKISFRSPAVNNNGDAVKVDHIDLIAGELTGKVSKFLADGVTPNPAYADDTNPSARVVARFTEDDWSRCDDECDDPRSGWQTVVYHLRNVKRDTYFRLRGSNLACGVANETDGQCNPLADDLVGANTPAKAYADLWFYSNPIFVRVSR